MFRGSVTKMLDHLTSNGEPEAKELIEDEVADIGGMPDVMNKIMDWGNVMVNQGIKSTFCFMEWIPRSTAWIGIYLLKLALAVLESVLLLVGSVAKILLLVLA